MLIIVYPFLMDNKRQIFFLLAFFISLIALLFVFIDNIYFHLIFKAKPGSCLILEERFCKTAVLKYKDDKAIGITFKVAKNVPIFSPAYSNYSSVESINSETLPKKSFTIGNHRVDNLNNKTQPWYTIYFDGEILPEYSNSKLGNKISKGIVFAHTDKNFSTVKNDLFLSITHASLNFNTINIKADSEAILSFYEKIIKN